MSSIGSPRPSWLSPVARWTAWPPSCAIPTSNETRVRVDGFSKIIPSVRPASHGCGSRRAWSDFRWSARSSRRPDRGAARSSMRRKSRPQPAAEPGPTSTRVSSGMDRLRADPVADSSSTSAPVYGSRATTSTTSSPATVPATSGRSATSNARATGIALAGAVLRTSQVARTAPSPGRAAAPRAAARSDRPAPPRPAGRRRGGRPCAPARRRAARGRATRSPGSRARR